MNMANPIVNLVWWELKFLSRYQLVAVSLFISLMYALLFFVFSVHSDKVLVLAVFSDPVMLGFLFTGVLILYDRNQGTNRAIAVMPIKLRHHLLARGLALTLLAQLCSFAMAFADRGLDFHLALFFLAVLINSLLYYYLGIIVLAGVDTFNAFIMRAAVMLAPLFLPLISLTGLFDSAWFYVFPTMASLIFINAAFFPVDVIDFSYAFSYLLLCLWLAARYAEKIYQEKLSCTR